MIASPMGVQSSRWRLPGGACRWWSTRSCRRSVSAARRWSRRRARCARRAGRRSLVGAAAVRVLRPAVRFDRAGGGEALPAAPACATRPPSRGRAPCSATTRPASGLILGLQACRPAHAAPAFGRWLARAGGELLDGADLWPGAAALAAAGLAAVQPGGHARRSRRGRRGARSCRTCWCGAATR